MATVMIRMQLVTRPNLMFNLLLLINHGHYVFFRIITYSLIFAFGLVRDLDIFKSNYVHATSCAIESHNFISSHSLAIESEQHLVLEPLD